MSRLLPVNIKQNNFWDGQQITDQNMKDEQNRNVSIDAATENNFFASGVLDETPAPLIIFDSSSLNAAQSALIDSYSFDGQSIYIGSGLTDVSDSIYGVNLSVEISNARLDGAANIKVLIIGDTFGGDLVHDDLVFERNGTQITRNRYKEIRGILFNNFAGNLRGSYKFACEEDGYNFVGGCVIREANALEISYDPIIVSQTYQPSIFFETFVPANSLITVSQMLQNAIGVDKSISDLNIGFASVAQREISPNDVTTKIGQKFQMSGTNIQKISILLSSQYNPAAAPGDGYNWSGSVVLTLHALQTEVDCPVTPTPDDAIDFDPDPAIVAQLSLDEVDLLYQGVDLTDGYVHVVDFVFTGSKISSPTLSNIEEDKYYIFTISRAGDTTIGTILLEEASDRIDNSYMSIFDGTQWINVTESDLWFIIYGDYIKISDGVAYDDGVGVEIPKIYKDTTNTEVPFIQGYEPLYTVTRNASNYVLLEVSSEYSDEEQDQRTGNSIASRVTPAPTFSLISSSSLTTLLTTDPDPVLLAKVLDQNPRGNPAEISGTSCFFGLVHDNILNILRPNADILQYNLIGSILSPAASSSYQYRIIKQTNYNDSYGDANGDGIIDLTDAALVTSWLDAYTQTYGAISGLWIEDGYVQERIADGCMNTIGFLRAANLNHTAGLDGYITATDAQAITDYINGVILSFSIGSTFSRTELQVESLLNPLTTTFDMYIDSYSILKPPFESCVTWRIDYVPTWIPDFIEITDLRRLLTTAYTYPINSLYPGGQNNLFVPGDILIDGYLLNPDGTPYSVDLEMNQIILEIPVTDTYGNKTFLDGYSGINIFSNFIAESSDGKTATGFTAMKYYDGSYVQIEDFDNNKVKITASLQSIVNQYAVSMGGTINDYIGMYYDPETSLLSVYVSDMYDDGNGSAPRAYHSNLMVSLNMKVLITVFLKKAMFKNISIEINAAQMGNLLGI